MNEYSLHAPFVYNLYVETIKKKSSRQEFLRIEATRRAYQNNHNIIETNSSGAGSIINKQSKRSISNISNGGITSEKYSSLFHRLITRYNAKTIWEFGTSLGINTLYLSSHNESQVTTFEGCLNTLDIAKSTFHTFARQNISCVYGNIDDTISNELLKVDHLDFVFFDANHRSKPTLRYFELCAKKSTEKSVFIFDDIHWSREMKMAWQQIQRDPLVSITIDLYQIGLVFFDHTLTKQNFILSY